MNTITDKKLVGGMINSIGFQQQDYASIKYMFKYLDNGLKQISFESADDFCIVLDKSLRIMVQVKVNQLTVGFIKNLFEKISEDTNHVIVGSSCDDEFRNVLQYKERYINCVKGDTYTDKQKLHSDWEEFCTKKSLDCSLLLKCDFDSIDSNNQTSIARDAIAQWAEKKNIYVDSNRFLIHLLSIVSEKRSQCGQLSKDEIEALVSQYRSPNRIPNYHNDPSHKPIIAELEQLINDNPRFANDLLVIKNDIENDNPSGAKNRIEKVFEDKILQKELQKTYLWTLNQLEDYSAVIAKKTDCYCIDTHYEIALAYFKLNDLDNSARCLDAFSKDLWSEDDYILRAYIYMLKKEDSLALPELKQCLAINSNNVDALIAIGFCYISKDQKKAADYFLKATSIDDECADAYFGLAFISECACDFKSALQYYQELERKKHYKLPSTILAKMGAYAHILKRNDSSIYFQKWNTAFRSENTIDGEKAVSLIVIGFENSYIFTLTSREIGVRVSLFDSIIYDENACLTAWSDIGVTTNWLYYQFNIFLNQDSLNPIRNDERTISEESLMPVITRTYANYEAFQNTCLKIVSTDPDKVHLNHILSETEREYIVDDPYINVELNINGKQLTGAVSIGIVTMPILVNPIGKGFEQFRKELSTDKYFNEAAIVLKYDTYESTFYFKKANIKIQYC